MSQETGTSHQPESVEISNTDVIGDAMNRLTNHVDVLLGRLTLVCEGTTEGMPSEDTSCPLLSQIRSVDALLMSAIDRIQL